MTSAVAALRSTSRRGYIDWLRGLAILIMIEVHVTDAWTRPTDRATTLFGYAKVLGGFAAPLFLFLAGVAVVFATRARLKATADLRVAARAVRRRGWQIFGLAFAFRFQAFILSPAALPGQLLKVDILNIMGLAIVAAAMICGVTATRRSRLVAFGSAMLFITLATPVVFDTRLVAWLPDPIEAYLRPVRPYTGFMLFPWAGFVFAGGLVATLLERGDQAKAVALHACFAAGGLIVAVASYYAWYLPSPYAHTEFWSTSPSFFFMRAGILVAAVGVVYFQHMVAPFTALGRARPMQRFGRSSLIVYWVHVELVYGVATSRIHHRLPIEWSIAGFVAMALSMYAMVVVKDVLEDRWKRRRARAEEAALPAYVSQG